MPVEVAAGVFGGDGGGVTTRAGGVGDFFGGDISAAATTAATCGGEGALSGETGATIGLAIGPAAGPVAAVADSTGGFLVRAEAFVAALEGSATAVEAILALRVRWGLGRPVRRGELGLGLLRVARRVIVGFAAVAAVRERLGGMVREVSVSIKSRLWCMSESRARFGEQRCFAEWKAAAMEKVVVDRESFEGEGQLRFTRPM